MKKQKVYIAHPYGGLDENKAKVEKLIKHLVAEKGKDFIFISPIHLFGYMYNTVLYEQGMDMCLQTLEECDMLLIPNFEYIENSKGCLMELAFAKGKGIKIQNWIDEWYKIVND